MGLSDQEFSRRFYAESTHLGKIKLAIREGRYTIWTRKDKPNFPEEYLKPILALPENHPVRMKRRESGREGMMHVLELKYDCRLMRRRISLYMKGYFAKDNELVIGLEVQSLRKDD